MSARDRTTPATPDKGDALGLAVLFLARRRSLDRLTLSGTALAAIMLVPAAINILEWLLRGQLSAWWADVFRFWFDRVGIPATVTQTETSLAWFNVTLPYLSVSVPAPDLLTWIAVLAATVFVAVLALRASDEFLPLRYFVLFAVFVQATALVFFAVAPGQFPYTASSYIDNGLKTAFGFLLLLPWGHALVYYIFDFSWTRKLWLTLLSLAFVVVAVPLQLTLHVYLLSCCSLLLMPLLSFVLGPTLIVLGCIALYGWAMSWDRRDRMAIAEPR